VTLLAMGEPTYELADARRAISVAVVGGLLVDPASAARLSIVLERRAQSVRASVELVDYQPRFWRLPVLWWLYGHTQAVVHAWGRRWSRHSPECLQAGPYPTDDVDQGLGGRERQRREYGEGPSPEQGARGAPRARTDYCRLRTRKRPADPGVEPTALMRDAVSNGARPPRSLEIVFGKRPRAMR
jgi:hypothetical protein